MRSLVTLLAAVTLVGVTLLAQPPGASACTCAGGASSASGPGTIVEGVVRELVDGSDSRPGSDLGGRPSSWSSVWIVDVESVERGAVAPDTEIELNITRGSGAGCGVAVGPVEAGRRYRIGGAYDEMSERLHLNLCSRALLEPLGDGADDGRPIPPDDPTDSTAVARVNDPDGGGLDGRVAGAATGALAGAGAGLFALRRRSS